MTTTTPVYRARSWPQNTRSAPHAPRSPRRREQIPTPPPEPRERETEAGFQAVVVELARRCGYLPYHPYDARKSEPGWPDLALCLPARAPAGVGRLIVAELKSARGRVSVAQRQWLEGLASVPGVEVAVWRPSDWLAIVAALVQGERLPPYGAQARVVEQEQEGHPTWDAGRS